MDRGGQLSPAGAGRDRHAPRHGRTSDLAAFEPADAGMCKRHWDRQEVSGSSRICTGFAGTTTFSLLQGGGGCSVSFGGLVWFFFF